jgi:hypothetical protein
MDAIEDTAGDLTEAKPPQPRRGHHAKIHEAVTTLRAQGKLPHNLRPGQRNKRIWDWLTQAGYGDDLPDRNALHRYFQWEQQQHEQNDATRSMTPAAEVT